MFLLTILEISEILDILEILEILAILEILDILEILAILEILEIPENSSLHNDVPCLVINKPAGSWYFKHYKNKEKLNTF